jgi:hypothetical protein
LVKTGKKPLLISFLIFNKFQIFFYCLFPIFTVNFPFPSKMSNYQIYGGIAEEEFVDVQDQDFVDAHFGVADNTGGHFGTTIGTTDVQYSKNAQGEIVGHNAGEDGAGQPPAESEYYDGNVGIDDAGGEAYLVEEVKQMVLEADEAEQQKEGEDGPEWVKEDGGVGELDGKGQQHENMPNEQIETPQLLEQPQLELEQQQQNEVAPDCIVVEEIARENDAEEGRKMGVGIGILL